MKHFKQCLMGIIMLFIANYSFAQTSYDTTQYYGKMNYIFSNVNKSLITTGLLKDYGIEFLNLDNYKGNILHDSNFVSIDEWRMLYSSLYSCQINSNANMLYLDTVNRLINKYNYTSMPVTFVGLYYNYQRFRDDAVTANLMSINNEMLYDVAGRTQSPYQAEELFAIAPIRQAVFTGSNNIIFRPELFKTNTGKTVNVIAIDTGTGSNYITVPWNTPYSITYSTKGFYNVNFKVTYTDGTVKYSHTKLVVYDNPAQVAARFGTRPTTNESVTATKPYLNVLGTGDITIDLAQSNTTGQIRKPLIVVEGFDADGGFTYSGVGGYLTYLNTDLNSNVAITLNNGLDDVNDYDLIFLNFANGSDYIQRNAYLLEAVIQLVNNRKTLYNGVRQQNVIIGMSMGGICTKYALRDMELNNLSHETRLFISHDAPHWGANIPVGAQAAVQHLAPFRIINVGGNFPFIRWVDMFPAIVDALSLFNSPAAQQMLIQRYDLGGVGGQTLTANNAVHDNFLNEINTMGWPVNCRNLTLANGACNGTLNFPDNSRIFVMNGDRSMTYFGSLWRTFVLTLSAPFVASGLVNGWNSPQFNSWALVWQFPLSLFATKSSIGLDFFVDAVPKTGTKEIYRGDIYSKKKILFVINVTNYFVKCHAQSNTNMLPLDNAPGGVYDLENFGFDPTIIQNSLPSFFQGYVQTTVLQPRFCFVPTVSSLSLINPQQNLISPLCANLACLRPTSVADYFAPQSNELHISYTQASSDWILNTQNPNNNCNQICSNSMSILGDNSVCTTSSPYTITGLPSGATVKWRAIPDNIVTINSPTATQTTITAGYNGGIITLIATITNQCGQVASAYKYDISIGSGVSSLVGRYYLNGEGQAHDLITYYGGINYIPSNSGFCSVFIDNPGLESATWSLYSGYVGGWTQFTEGANPILLLFPPYGDPVTFRLSNTNTCGTYDFDVLFAGQSQYGYYSISPNPTTSTLTVSVDETKLSANRIAKSSDQDIREIVILDKTGMVQLKQTYSIGTRQLNMNVSVLKPGVYIVRIFNGKQWTTMKLIKE